MKTTTGIAAIALCAALALTGCATTAATTPTVPFAHQAAPFDNPTKTDVVIEVQDNWVGTPVPTPEWITTAATLVCKRDIAGIDQHVGNAGRYAGKNDTVVIDAARKLVCD